MGGDGGGFGGAEVAHDGGRFEEGKVVGVQDGGDFSNGVDFEVFGCCVFSFTNRSYY